MMMDMSEMGWMMGGGIVIGILVVATAGARDRGAAEVHQAAIGTQERRNLPNYTPS